MKELIKLANERMIVLQKAIQVAENDEGGFPEGRIRIS